MKTMNIYMIWIIIDSSDTAYTTGTLGTATSTVAYGYNSTYWRDQLTSYNGTTITYDAVGNPLKWRDGMSFTWKAGRQMNSTKLQNGKTYGYEYNEDGIRYSKWEYGGLNTTYYLDGSTIIAEKNSKNTIIYKHDENGRYVGFNLNGTDYYYAYNAQGDVMGIYSTNGAFVARYTYDPWGKVLAVRNVAGAIVTSSTHVGNINPIRYRGYYYDAETGLYYLNSRYYDPTVGRFVNSDAYVQTGTGIMDKNMYAYCLDDPVNMVDYDGDFPCSANCFFPDKQSHSIDTCRMLAAQGKHSTMDSAANAWKNSSSSKSMTIEKGAFIYKTTDKSTGAASYSCGRTHTGQIDNTVPQFIFGYVAGQKLCQLSVNMEMVGYVHGHPPLPPSIAEGNHNDYPSGADLFLLNLPGINEVYVVPWDRCEGAPEIMKGTDMGTWCPKYLKKNFPDYAQ